MSDQEKAESVGNTAGEDVWNPVETMDPSEVRTRQDSILPARIEKAYREGGLYRKLYDSLGLTADSYGGRDDLPKFPVVSKDMVRAHRADTGDIWGGLSAGLVPGASVSHGSGTSGTATLQVSTPADRDTIADEWASFFWGSGVRSGTKVLQFQNFGVRTELTMPLGTFKLGAVYVLPDISVSSIDQLEYVRPQATWAYPGWLDGLVEAAAKAGRDLDALLEPLQILWWGGRYLSPLKRERLEARVGATIYENGGMGDVGLHTAGCSAQDGTHVREDLFVVETIDPETEQPVDPGTPGELVFTSLFDEGMNYVRWRSDDLGVVKHDPCACGRTSARISQLGRVWERTIIDGVTVMPGQIDDLLYEVEEKDVPFQLVRSADGTRRPFLRVAAAGGATVQDLAQAVSAGLQLDIDVRETSAEDIMGGGGKPVHKYAQVKDE